MLFVTGDAILGVVMGHADEGLEDGGRIGIVLPDVPGMGLVAGGVIGKVTGDTVAVGGGREPAFGVVGEGRCGERGAVVLGLDQGREVARKVVGVLGDASGGVDGAREPTVVL